jgi:hypothetical protein
LETRDFVEAGHDVDEGLVEGAAQPSVGITRLDFVNEPERERLARDAADNFSESPDDLEVVAKAGGFKGVTDLAIRLAVEDLDHTLSGGEVVAERWKARLGRRVIGDAKNVSQTIQCLS